MTEGSGPKLAISGRGGGDRRLGDYLPWPLVGVAILLVVLILLTPNLLTSGGPPAAGTVLTQAELIVDRVLADNVTHFYIRGLGSTVRYDSIEVTWAAGFTWTGTGTPSWNSLNWSVALNETDVLAAILNSTRNPIALNITALYNENGVAYYAGVFAFYVSNATQSPADSLLGVSPTSGVTVPSSTALTSLPLPITLADLGSRGP